MAIGFASAQRRRLLTVGALAVVALLVPAAASRADSAASFTYSPAAPLTGQPVMFTSTSTGTKRWGFNNNDDCADAEGGTVQHSFPTAGQYPVWLCVNDGTTSKQMRTITVLNRPPIASFTYSPSNPVVGEPVTLTSTSLDPDGPLVAEDWAMGTGGPLAHASAATVTRSWSVPGVYPVTLQVRDRDGASRAATRWIPVHHKPLRLLGPFPVVRLVGQVTAKGTEVELLTVQAPRGARVSVRCHGRKCPYRRAGARSRGVVRFRRLQRLLPAGTVLELSVTKRGTIGKYTRFRIRRGLTPARLDRCLKSGAKRPMRCPG